MEGFRAALSLGKSGAAEAVVANNTATPAKKMPFMMIYPVLGSSKMLRRQIIASGRF